MKKAAGKSLIVIGPMTSLATQITAPIAAQQKVMAIPAAGGAETIQESRPWAVVLMMPNVKRSEFMMNTWLDRNPEIKSVVMLNYPKVAQWKKLVELRKEALAKRGVKTLEVIDVQAGAVDISSVVVRTLKSKPDGVVLSLMGADTVRIVQELTNRGFKNRGAIFSHSTVDSPETYSLSAEAGGVMEGTYIGAFGIKADTPEFQKLLAEFRKVKGQEKAETLMWGDLFYVATYMVKDAIEKTGVTGDPAKLEEERAKIRDHINTMKNFDTRIRGHISAMPDGSFTVPNFLGIVKKNKLEIVMSTNEYFKK
jgi:branched-chain amino acid transport system substrate-binding protein